MNGLRKAPDRTVQGAPSVSTDTTPTRTPNTKSKASYLKRKSEIEPSIDSKLSKRTRNNIESHYSEDTTFPKDRRGKKSNESLLSVQATLKKGLHGNDNSREVQTGYEAEYGEDEPAPSPVRKPVYSTKIILNLKRQQLRPVLFAEEEQRIDETCCTTIDDDVAANPDYPPSEQDGINAAIKEGQNEEQTSPKLIFSKYMNPGTAPVFLNKNMTFYVSDYITPDDVPDENLPPQFLRRRLRKRAEIAGEEIDLWDGNNSDYGP